MTKPSPETIRLSSADFEAALTIIDNPPAATPDLEEAMARFKQGENRMIRIFADFNHSDEEGRVILNTHGALADIEPHKDELKEGMVVLLYVPGEFEVQGRLILDNGVWLATQDMKTVTHYEEENE